MKDFREIGRQLVNIGQLGLSVIMPILLCILFCYWLTDRYTVGTWVYIPGFVFGLGAAFMTVYKFYLAENQKSDKKEEHKSVSFNRHI